jgi:uncharacterized cupin superfamily protein
MPKVDLDAIPQINRTGYPEPYSQAVQGRWYRRMAPATGLSDFGVSHVVLKPGAWSSQRHWHEGEDEFLVMLAGEAVLIDDEGRTLLRAGDCVAFPKNDGNGHHLVNESGADVVVVVMGRPSTTDCHYPDTDLHLDAASGKFTHKDGTPY